MAVDVTEDRFESEVLAKSRTVPVLVDFWAEWCGPCRMLGPVLDRLEREYAGRFVLAKVNTDHSPGIAGRYKVSGIPAVKLFRNGEVVDQFVGAFPEPQVRRFLDAALPNPELDGVLDTARSSPLEAARTVLEKGLAGKEASQILWLGALAALAPAGTGADEAHGFLSAIPTLGDPYSDAKAALLGFLERGSGPDRLKLLSDLLCPQPQAALESILKQVVATSGEGRSAHRSDMIAAFHLLGNGGPIVEEYRRKLAAALF